MSDFFLWLPFILWILWNINFLRWFIISVQRKENYEIAMSIAMELLFTTIFIGNYLDPIISGNLILQIAGNIMLWFGFFFIYLYQRRILKKLGGGPPNNYESTTILIESGWFKIMRHPMFFCGIISNIGCFLVGISILSLIFIPVSIGLCIISAYWEEKLNLQKFGNAYKEYMKRVKRWGLI